MPEFVAAGQAGHLLDSAGFAYVGAGDAGGFVADCADGTGDGGVGGGLRVGFGGDVGVDVVAGGGRGGKFVVGFGVTVDGRLDGVAG